MRGIVAAIVCLGLSWPLLGQSHDHPSPETIGSVTFNTSCAAEIQPEFNHAVALMHSFQFGPAIQGYRSILMKDPGCAIADWGIALSSWGNPFAGFKSPAQLAQGLKAVEDGRRIGAKTERERAYIEAVAHLYVDSATLPFDARTLAYERAMEKVTSSYPEDKEAAIFYALALAADADPTDKSNAKQLKAGAMLEKLFAEQPNHPGLAHYIIHAYDQASLAPKAADAARRYGKIAPSTPHALHMPSHTFTRIGEWQSSIDTNVLSAATAVKANQPADVLHADDYMVYAYLQTGQDEAAKRVVLSAVETFAGFDPAHATGAAPPSAAFYARAAIPARYCLERKAWAEAAKLSAAPSPTPYADSITYLTIGLGAAHLKDEAGARSAMTSIEQMRDKLKAMNEDYWANQSEMQRQEVAAMLSFSTGHKAEGIAGIRAAAAMEDKTELATVTPGPLVPAREMLAEMLLDTGRPSEALHEFEEALKREPNRFWSLYGAANAAKRAGDQGKAAQYLHQLAMNTAKADTPGRTEIAAIRKLH